MSVAFIRMVHSGEAVKMKQIEHASSPGSSDDSERDYVYRVSQGDSGVRLDRFLVSRTQGRLSRNRLQSLIHAGHVLLDGAPCVKPNYKLRGEKEICLHVPASECSDIRPESIALEIVYEDQDIAVVNKPSGIACHPVGPVRTGTLVNALLYHLDNLSGIAGVIRPGIIHRLDKGTSGLVVVAKNDRSHQVISRQFSERKIHKEYLAVVRGHPCPEHQVLDGAIARSRSNRKRFTVARHGRPAETEIRVLECLRGHARVVARPRTGRTHQIRVHLSRCGHPVVGDVLYGYRIGDPFCPGVRKQLEQYPGFLLHAWKLCFVHPVSEKEMEFQVESPAIFETVLNDLS